MTIGKTVDSKKTIIVAGINGFVGQHVARALHKNGCTVVGLGNTPLVGALQDIVDTHHVIDLMDPAQTATLPVEHVDAIINLAGFTNVGKSFEQRDECFRINREVHTNVADLVLQKNPSVRILAISTGAVFDSLAPMPLDEASPTIEDGSPYALSKLAMEHALESYRQNGLSIVVARPFNHTGPGQGRGFLVPDLIYQLREASSQDQKITVGNLATRRDYTDVRDIASAYAALACADANTLSHNLYNICSGKSRSGQDILDELMKLMNLEGKIEVVVDHSRFRPSDPQDFYGSSERIRAAVGWTPQIDFTTTLQDFLASA